MSIVYNVHEEIRIRLCLDKPGTETKMTFGTNISRHII